ncbi:MAG: tyrosine-type recombinase/integrase [Lachnospiraceae bacterium]|nr:tyrosine-type recombinase/integrase [Lachnospiraceae bacterium]
MNMTQPIRDEKRLQLFKHYYATMEPNVRNQAMIVLGLNTALRINDILHITWRNIFDFENEKIKDHLNIKERKTGKQNRIAINQQSKDALMLLLDGQKPVIPEGYLFQSRKGCNQPLSRSQAYRIVKKAAVYAGYPESVSCHSLRKTFGYYAWQQGAAPAVLMSIYNHSSYQITKRYLGIEQDDKDSVFLNIKI